MTSQDIDLLWQQALDENEGSVEKAYPRYAELILQSTIDYGLQLGEDTDWIMPRWGF